MRRLIEVEVEGCEDCPFFLRPDKMTAKCEHRNMTLRLHRGVKYKTLVDEMFFECSFRQIGPRCPFCLGTGMIVKRWNGLGPESTCDQCRGTGRLDP